MDNLKKTVERTFKSGTVHGMNVAWNSIYKMMNNLTLDERTVVISILDRLNKEIKKEGGK